MPTDPHATGRAALHRPRFAWSSPRLPARPRLLLAALLALLPLLAGVAVARQEPETDAPVVSPATGHASVIAQGLAALPPGDLAWRVTYRSTRDAGAPGTPTPDAQAGGADAGPGFVAAEQGGLLTALGDGRSALLLPGEAAFAEGGLRDVRQAGGEPGAWFDIELVPAGAAAADVGGLSVYAGAPFASPAGADPRDLGLVRDVLGPEESTTIAAQAAPTLVLATQGTLRVVSSDGSSAELAVGQAGAFAGGLTITGTGTASSSFLAAVVGGAAAIPGAGATAGATPQAATGAGAVAVVVYGCPADVRPRRASPDTCRLEPGAADLRLVALDGGTPRDLGAPTVRDGLPVWEGLPTGAYALRAAGFAGSYDRLFVPGLEAVAGDGADGVPAGDDGGYRLDLSAEAPSARLEAYALGGSEPAGGGAIRVAGDDESTPAAERTPRADRTPNPERTPRADRGADAAGTATPVTTSAVARPRRGSITVRVFSCPDPFATFDPARCAAAAEPYDVSLTGEDGAAVSLADARPDGAGVWVWENLPFGQYLVQQPLLAPGAATYYLPNAELAADGSGYLVAIAADAPRLEVDLFGLAPEVAPAPTPIPAVAAPTDVPAAPDAGAGAAASATDSDGDGLTDDFETGVLGTDPAVSDSDGDGVNDGQENVNGSNPLAADAPAPPPVDGGQTGTGDGGTGAAPPPAGTPTDGDGDGLTDEQEAQQGTSPVVADSDGDGFSDGAEVGAGTSPRDSGVFPAQ